MQDMNKEGLHCWVEDARIRYEFIDGPNLGTPLAVGTEVSEIEDVTRNGDIFTIQFRKVNGQRGEEHAPLIPTVGDSMTG